MSLPGAPFVAYRGDELFIDGCATSELAERFGYHTIVTDSAKLANIIAGYDYNPVFRPTDICIQAAIEGELPW